MINRFCVGVFLLEVGVKVNKKMGLVLICIMLFTPLKIEAAKGCCSHHGGVSGCSSSGRQICKDGTLSPTCTCTPVVTYTYGCTDKKANNYNSKANKDDGSCIYYVYGCTDEIAKNYNPKANKDNGNCEYYIYGCMDKLAKNYNLKADKDDGSCEYYVFGCTDALADNYNSEADKDDGNCIFSVVDELEKIDNEDNTEDDSGLLDFVIGVGAISGGVYLYKKRKKK